MVARSKRSPLTVEEEYVGNHCGSKDNNHINEVYGETGYGVQGIQG